VESCSVVYTAVMADVTHLCELVLCEQGTKRNRQTRLSVSPVCHAVEPRNYFLGHIRQASELCVLGELSMQNVGQSAGSRQYDQQTTKSANVDMTNTAVSSVLTAYCC